MRQFFLVLVLVLALMLPQSRAGGGGLCAQPVSESKDAVPHVVTGAHMMWGAPDVLDPGKEVRYRFDRPGTYPYMCHLHIGMAGAILVGR